MRVKAFAVLFNILAVIDGQRINWCTMQNCAANSHVACNNNGLFSPTCNSPAAMPLSVAQKQQLLNMHNAYRNQVASGNLPRFASARRMAQLTWNDLLAGLAELNTKQCKMAHDSCRNTPSYRYSGQNLAIMMTTGGYTIENVINGSMSMWFNEYVDANMNDINRYSATSSSGKAIGHFTALVTDRTTQVGCSMAFFKTQTGSILYNSYLLACNYASTNILGASVYKTGTKASGCALGADSTYPGLCKTAEPIDANAVN